MFPIDFQAVAKIMNVGIIIADAEGCILWVNPTIERLLNRPNNDVSQWSYDDAPVRNFRTDMSPMPLGELAGHRARAEGQVIRDVLTGILPPSTSEVHWFLCNATPVFDPDADELIGSVTELTDVTIYREQQQEIERLVRSYEALMDAMRTLLNQQASAPTDTRIQELTSRQVEVLKAVARGLSNGQIARDLGLEPATVRRYVSDTKRALGCANRVEMARLAFQANLLPLFEDSN